MSGTMLILAHRVQRKTAIDGKGQGWARDVKARDQDETETLTSRDRDEAETLASPAETRPRRVCSSRDVIETLKHKFY